MLESFKSPAIIVAHPDDETLWAGGLLARFGHKITLVCCSTPSKDSIRAEKCMDAANIYGVRRFQLCGSEDEGPDTPLKQLFIPSGDYDVIVTHNEAGEYGHLHHKQVHNVVVNKWDIPIFTFGPRKTERGAIEFKLTPEEIDTRQRALQCYDHLLPYCGRTMTKWQALIERYGELKPVETYDAHIA